ncbi:MAG TPA: hypothetical protein VGY54_26815 [Polyangiaceae bacterium]|nr:hypothetical protein [Polyangiaceae bacterium]
MPSCQPLSVLSMWTAAVLAAFTFSTVWATSAHADDDVEVSVSKGQVTVVAKGDWHINPEYPWKLIVGEAKLDKSKFNLSEKVAVVRGAPAGAGTLRGAVCAAGTCRSLVKEVVIP